MQLAVDPVNKMPNTGFEPQIYDARSDHSTNFDPTDMTILGYFKGIADKSSNKCSQIFGFFGEN